MIVKGIKIVTKKKSKKALIWLHAISVFAQRGVGSHVHTPAHPKSIYVYKNMYVQISISNIASYAQKLSSQ